MGRDTIVKMANFCRTIFVYCKNQRFKFQTCCFCMLIFEQKKRKCNTVLKSKDFLVFFFFNSKDRNFSGITNPTWLQSSTRVKMNYLAKNSFVRELSGFLLGCVQNPRIMRQYHITLSQQIIKSDKNDCKQDFYNLFSNLISIVLCN